MDHKILLLSDDFVSDWILEESMQNGNMHCFVIIRMFNGPRKVHKNDICKILNFQTDLFSVNWQMFGKYD